MQSIACLGMLGVAQLRFSKRLCNLWTSRLLHSPSLVAIGLSAGYEIWSSYQADIKLLWLVGLNIDWDCLVPNYIMGSRDQWEFPPFSDPRNSHFAQPLCCPRGLWKNLLVWARALSSCRLRLPQPPAYTQGIPDTQRRLANCGDAVLSGRKLQSDQGWENQHILAAERGDYHTTCSAAQLNAHWPWDILYSGWRCHPKPLWFSNTSKHWESHQVSPNAKWLNLVSICYLMWSIHTCVTNVGHNWFR